MATKSKQQGSSGGETDEIIRDLKERVERAEAELEQVKAEREPQATTRANTQASHSGGEEDLRKDTMMAHLLDSLQAGQNIGHYGRLVFAMVARHFMSSEEVVRYLVGDPDFSETEATTLVRQVQSRNYNPPKRERILEWQSQQEFPIVPHPEDPDCGNLYRNLKFPDSIYENIEHYQEEKTEAEEATAE